jgi:excisionase family DNA binding protein
VVRQPERRKETTWLTLSQAAARLNVHPTTLRRWADEGQIPFMLTPGGHRRFADSDVDHLGGKRHTVRGLGPVERIWAREALERTRQAITARHDDSWLKRHDAAARERSRVLGQHLMMITMRYLTEESENEGLVVEARTIGRQYGESARGLGLSLTSALQASMFFRDALVAAAVDLPENVRIPPASQLDIVKRISKVLNTAQLGVAEAYSDERGASPHGTS